MDNVDHNFTIIQHLLDTGSLMIFKPVIILTASIIECILYDFLTRIQEHSYEKVENLSENRGKSGYVRKWVISILKQSCSPYDIGISPNFHRKSVYPTIASCSVDLISSLLTLNSGLSLDLNKLSGRCSKSRTYSPKRLICSVI